MYLENLAKSDKRLLKQTKTPHRTWKMNVHHKIFKQFRSYPVLLQIKYDKNAPLHKWFNLEPSVWGFILHVQDEKSVLRTSQKFQKIQDTRTWFRCCQTRIHVKVFIWEKQTYQDSTFYPRSTINSIEELFSNFMWLHFFNFWDIDQLLFIPFHYIPC